MEVYIEYVIIDNIIINYILLSLCSKVSGQSCKRLNVVFSAMLGALLVLFMPLVTNYEVLLLLYRIVVGVLITLCVRRHDSIKQWLSYFLIFISFTFLFGGLLIAMLSMFDIVYTTSGLIFLNFEIPLSLFALPIWLYSCTSVKVCKYLSSKLKQRHLYYDIAISVYGKRHILRAFLDTGNNLYDDNGKPCIVMELKTFCKIFENFPIQKILLGNVNVNDLPHAHYINVSTVNANEDILVFQADLVTISNGNELSEFSNVSVAVSRKNFIDYNLILHRNFC